MSVGDEKISAAMRAEEKRMKQESRHNEAARKKAAQVKALNLDEAEKEKKFQQIMALVSTSKVYAQFLLDRLEEKKSDHKALPTRGKRSATGKKSITDYINKGNSETVTRNLKNAAREQGGTSTAAGSQNLRPANQPKAVTGGVMRPYQLEGLHWLKSLYENGLNGILADEMGLGKTVQTIAFLAFLREKQTYGPFLVVAPLSTLSNWIDEFSTWTPSIPKVLYHGSPDQRTELRERRLNIDERSDKFPVVCTSYEICMNDRKFLEKYNWKYIIIDEGHRLKNKNCRLIQELKRYNNTNRLLITGTPLQNDMSELWSLLNYLMPEFFSNQQDFDSMFNFSSIVDSNGDKEAIVKERKNKFVIALHAILKPFLLRRVKSDVESDLPKKREYILYAPLTDQQKTLYKRILDGTSRAFLEEQVVDRLNEISDRTPSRSSSLKRKCGDDSDTPNKSAKSSRASTPGSRSSVKKRQAAKRKSYKEAGNDDALSDEAFLQQLDSSGESEDPDEEEQRRQSLARTLELAKKVVSHKKLQNPVMQLRLACNSPHNFYWPWGDGIPDKNLVDSSGKLLILDRLVPYLLEKGHKILIFSQFKTQLDILEDWASLVNGWQVCRIDGSVKHDDRRRQILDFNTDPEAQLFLLSTRAGGQGINLTAADTVILFDSDWNPQQDLQAQDRVHRIGQKRPVIVYRLATKGTVEQTLLERADGKRRLEKLVIQKGKFLFRKRLADGENEEEELGDAFDEDGFESYDPGQSAEQMLSEADLKLLTDRSDAAYERAEKGLDTGEKFKAVERKKGGDGLLGELGTR